jgi:hypothetical protein
LELIEKLSYDSLIEINNVTEIKEFKKNYSGNNKYLTFIAVYDSKNSSDSNSEFYKCIKELAENINYKALFYFGMIPIDKYEPRLANSRLIVI